MTLITYSSEERDRRLASYKMEDGKLDAWLMMADLVSVAKEFNKTEEETHKLLKSIWEKLEIRTTQ